MDNDKKHTTITALKSFRDERFVGLHKVYPCGRLSCGKSVGNRKEKEQICMYLMIDNYDSFVYNLAAYFEELDRKILVKRNDEISMEEIEALCPEGIIISPGPKAPESAGESIRIVQTFSEKIPILGVCLGHQVIGYASGGTITKGKRPMHGKVTPVLHKGKRIFQGLPDGFGVTRYHSLVVCEEDLPENLEIDARSEDGAIMAISRKDAPVYGIQFHPEAVLTQYGHEMLENFTKLCEKWWEEKKGMISEASAV